MIIKRCIVLFTLFLALAAPAAASDNLSTKIHKPKVCHKDTPATDTYNPNDHIRKVVECPPLPYTGSDVIGGPLLGGGLLLSLGLMGYGLYKILEARSARDWERRRRYHPHSL